MYVDFKQIYYLTLSHPKYLYTKRNLYMYVLPKVFILMILKGACVYFVYFLGYVSCGEEKKDENTANAALK